MNVLELIGRIGEAVYTKKEEEDKSKAQTANDTSITENPPVLERKVKTKRETVEDMLRRHAELSKRIDEKAKNNPE